MRVLAFGFLAMLLSVSSAQAVLIDGFNPLTDQQTTTNVAAPPTQADATSISGAGIIGGWRNVRVEKTLGASFRSMDAVVSGDVLSVDRGSGVDGEALIRWDGADNAPTSLDPLVGNAFALPVTDLDADGSIGVRIQVVDADIIGHLLTLTLFTDATTWSSFQLATTTVVIPPAVENVDFLFGAVPFATGASPVDINSVTAISLLVSSPVGRTSSDISFNFIETYVPEPSSLLMLGMGAVGLIASRRRRLATAQRS